MLACYVAALVSALKVTPECIYLDSRISFPHHAVNRSKIAQCGGDLRLGERLVTFHGYGMETTNLYGP